MAEPPVEAFKFSGFGSGFAIFRAFDIFWRWHDHMVFDNAIIGPVSWHCAFVFIAELHSFHSPQDLLHIASEFLGVIEYNADDTFIVHDKDGAHGVCVLSDRKSVV